MIKPEPLDISSLFETSQIADGFSIGLRTIDKPGTLEGVTFANRSYDGSFAKHLTLRDSVIQDSHLGKGSGSKKGMRRLRILAVSMLPVFFSIGCATTSVATLDKPVYSIGCENLENYSSASSEERYVIDFLNSRDKSVYAHWIDFDGREILKMAIKPGETGSQNTYVGHPWVMREATGECVAAYHSTSRVLVEIR